MQNKHESSTDRRSFLMRSMGMGAAAMLGGGALFNHAARASTESAETAGDASPRAALNSSDVAILKFLAAAELLEEDLWGQYCELAMANKGFIKALSKIDPALPSYVCQDHANENSHALFINSYLVANGQTAVNLDPFRTLPSVKASGAGTKGRLTNLTNLTVDTSYYTRYRSAGNPDFGDTFPQIAMIKNQATVPISDSIKGKDMQAIAESAAFHFAAIEQGGSSLYNSLITKVSSLDSVAILASIGPVEVYQFSAFHGSLAGISKIQTSTVDIPDLHKDKTTAFAHFPLPCKFLDPTLAPNSVIRPRNTNTAGAVAAATGLVASGLFMGQPQGFLDAVVALATAADNGVRVIS